MKKVYAFDFDGTLTNRDSLLAFIRYAKGTTSFCLGFLLHAPWLVLMLLGLYPNWKAKQRVFSYFFRGMPLEAFDALCQAFAKDNRHLLRPLALQTIEKVRSEEAEVVIVSASIDNWVQPFFPDVKVIGTQVEVINGRLTGLFLTKNCYGQEKVNRLLDFLPDRHSYKLIAYGDSRGDQELLAFADEAHFKPFRL